jgi:hypothetical protein
MDHTVLVAILAAAVALIAALIAVERRRVARLLVAGCLCFLVALMGLLWLIGQDGDEPTGSGSTSASGTPSTSTPSTITTEPPPNTHDEPVSEVSDNHRGVAVYANAQGEAVPGGIQQRIPYGTTVTVACYESNASEMTSVHAFYRIVGGPWDGLSAVSDSFDNGAGMGPNGVDLDPRVKPC